VWGFSKRNGKKIVVGTHVIIVEGSAKVVRSNRFLLLSSLDVDGPLSLLYVEDEDDSITILLLLLLLLLLLFFL
jgi:hypothetical protein